MIIPIEIGLHAVVIAVEDNTPLILTVSENEKKKLTSLPFGPFNPNRHQTLEAGLRNWVESQTKLDLGYVEQLYTFGDLDRLRSGASGDVHFISIGYLALVRRGTDGKSASSLDWHSWYLHFPWENWRTGQPQILGDVIIPALAQWVQEYPQEKSSTSRLGRATRFRMAFGCDLPANGTPVIDSWDEERVLERYELMYEAGLVDEAVSDGQVEKPGTSQTLGHSMLHDHRRILATAIARLRAKLKYRPVVFELMPETFTLTELQHTVETLSGQAVHKQNFRRMVENAELVEPTGATSSQTGGRPAAIFRFRHNITNERPAPGLKV